MENKVPKLIEEREERLALAEEDVPALLARKTIPITSTERELIEFQLKNLRAMRFVPDETNDRVGIFALADVDGSEEEMVVYLGTTNEGEPAVLGGVMRRPNQEGETNPIYLLTSDHKVRVVERDEFPGEYGMLVLQLEQQVHPANANISHAYDNLINQSQAWTDPKSKMTEDRTTETSAMLAKLTSRASLAPVFLTQALGKINDSLPFGDGGIKYAVSSGRLV